NYKLEFCTHVDNHLYNDNKAIQKDEIRFYILKYFKEHVQTINELDDNFWMFFHCCRFKNYTKSGNSYYEDNKYHPEAIQLFKEFMLTAVDDILVEFIENLSLYNRKSKTDNYVRVSTIIPEIFGSYNGLAKLLRSKKFRSNL